MAADVITDLDRISQLGFNAIWVSPLLPTSAVMVKRFNAMTGEDELAKGSLYAAIDFSQLNHQMFPDLVDSSAQVMSDPGNPQYSSPHEKAMLQLFTSTAKKNGLSPLFDLVLNHAGADAALITGKSPYFVKKGIATEKWFQKRSKSWDDVFLFNYSDPVIREEIIRELWLPYITKYINDFGFAGARIDFAGGRLEVREVEKILCQEMQRLMAIKGTTAIIYAELLPPANKLEENATALRGLYTHVTNGNVWGAELAEYERGIKQQTTHLMSDDGLRNLPGGTVGFAGSHDHGPNARNAVKLAAIKTIDSDGFKRHMFNRKLTPEFARAITEQVQLTRDSEYKMNECLLVQRQRLALTALTSDGGWCLFGGDEFGKQTPASVFLNRDEKPMYNDIRFFNEAKQQAKWHHTGLIKDINAAIADMPRAIFPHLAKILNLPSFDGHLVIVMNFNGEGFSDPQPILTIVNVSDKPVQLFDALIGQIAAEFKSSQDGNLEAFESVLRAKKQLIGNFDSQLKKYEVVKFYHAETIDADNRAPNTDQQQAMKVEINSQLYPFSIFKEKVMSQTKDDTAYQKNESSSECNSLTR